MSLNFALENKHGTCLFMGSSSRVVGKRSGAFAKLSLHQHDIAGFLGLAIAVGTLETVLLCGLAIVVYALLPFAEEPWLARHYGKSYDAYRQRTPRFLSISKLFGRRVTRSMQRTAAATCRVRLRS
jgi:hypothetical protein